MSKPTLGEHLLGGKRLGRSLMFKLTILGVLLSIAGLAYVVFDLPKISVGGVKIYAEDPGFKVRKLDIPTSRSLEFSSDENRKTFEQLLFHLKKRDQTGFQAAVANYRELVHRERDICPVETASHIEGAFGEGLLIRGDLEGAIEHLEASLEFWPTNRWATIKLYRAYRARSTELIDTWPEDVQQTLKDLDTKIQALEDKMEALGIDRLALLDLAPFGNLLQGYPLRPPGVDGSTLPWVIATLAADAPDLEGLAWSQLFCDLVCESVVPPFSVDARCTIAGCTPLGSAWPDSTAVLDAAMIKAELDHDRPPRSTVIAVGINGSTVNNDDGGSLITTVFGWGSSVFDWTGATIDGAHDAKPGAAYSESLDYAVRDATRMARAFESGGFDSHLLVGANANRWALIENIAADVLHSRPGDELVIYLAGHAVTDANGTGALAVASPDGQPDLLPFIDLEAVLSHHAGKVTVIVDGCRNPFNGTLTPTATPTTDFGTNRSTWLFAAQDGGVAIESDRVQGGVFTHVLLDWLAEQPAGALHPEVNFETWAARTEHLAANLHGVVQQPELMVGEH